MGGLCESPGVVLCRSFGEALEDLGFALVGLWKKLEEAFKDFGVSPEWNLSSGGALEQLWGSSEADLKGIWKSIERPLEEF